MPILTEIILSLLYTSLFILLIYKMKFFNAEGLSKRLIAIIFFVKIFFGLALWAVYTFYYTDRLTADIYKYFDDSKVMFDALYERPSDYFRMLLGIGNDQPYFDVYYSKMNNWYREFDSNLYNDSHTIIRFNALIHLFSFGYFNVHTVFINFFSLTGLFALYKTFSIELKEKKQALIFALFFIPSVLFWGSGVLKEGLIFFAMGLLIYHSNRLMNGRSYLLSSILILFSVLILVQTKFYILVTILPAIIAFQWAKRTRRFIVLKYTAVFFLVVFIGLNTQRVFPGYDALEILAAKQKDFINLANGGMVLYNDKIIVKIEDDKRNTLVETGDKEYKILPGSSFEYWKKEELNVPPGKAYSKDTCTFKLLWDMPRSNSKIDIAKLEPSLWSLLLNSPKALLNVMFRPTIIEARSFLMVFAAVENTFLLLVIAVAFFYRKPFKEIDLNLVLFCLSFVVFLYVIIGITTPVLGAIARYKIPALPFLLIALFEIIDVEKLKKKFQFLDKLLG